MIEQRDEYDRVTREIALSADRQASLAAEIAKVKKDNASITAALIQSAKTEKKLGQDIEDIGDRAPGAEGAGSRHRGSLAGRRGVLAEVLGALQRMGLNPPPAILVTPEDALSSVRSAILLGAVVPGCARETEVLVADLAELSRIAASIEDERGRLVAACRRTACREEAARPPARGRSSACRPRARQALGAEQNAVRRNLPTRPGA